MVKYDQADRSQFGPKDRGPIKKDEKLKVYKSITFKSLKPRAEGTSTCEACGDKKFPYQTIIGKFRPREVDGLGAPKIGLPIRR